MITITADTLFPGFDPDRPDVEHIQSWARADFWTRSGVFLDAPKFAGANELPEKAQEWADDIAAGGEGNLLLWGPTGSGKTYSASAAGRYLATIWDRAQHGPRPLRMMVCSTWLMRAKTGPWEERQERFEEVSKVTVLILDDIARSRLTEKDRELVSELLDARMNNMLPTVLTTNRLPYLPDEDEEELPDGHYLKNQLYDLVGSHIISRILGGSTVIEMNGVDRRNPEGAF